MFIVRCEVRFYVTHRRLNLHNFKVRQRDGTGWERAWLLTLLVAQLNNCVQVPENYEHSLSSYV